MADNKSREPRGKQKQSPKKTAKICEYMTYSTREAFKRLRTNVLIALEESPKSCKHVIGITSALPSEGKSTVSINLAYTLAEQGRTVALLDCDLRRPSLHTKMSISQTPGLTDVLTGKENLKNAVVRYQSATNNVYFDLIASGELPENPAEILSSRNFLRLLEVVKSAYDVVILDLPPVNAVTDATVASQLTDGLVLVIREDHCPRFVLNDCMEQLRYAKVNILGFVMNGSVNGAKKRYQYGNAYRYDTPYYQYGK